MNFNDWLLSILLENLNNNDPHLSVNHFILQSEPPIEYIKNYVKQGIKIKTFLEFMYFYKAINYVEAIFEQIMEKLPIKTGVITEYVNCFIHYQDFQKAEAFINKIFATLPKYILEIRMTSLFSPLENKMIGIEEISTILDFWNEMSDKYPNKIKIKFRKSKYGHYPKIYPTFIHFIADKGSLQLLERTYRFCEKFKIEGLCQEAILATQQKEKIEWLSIKCNSLDEPTKKKIRIS